MSSDSTGKRYSRLRAALWTFGVAFIVFSIVGFFVAPAVVRSVLVKKASQMLGRTVSVGRIRVNPYTLSVSVEDLRVLEKDGATFVGWNRIFVDWEIISLLTGETVFREISLTKPVVRVAIAADGSLNFADIIERLKAAAAATPTTTKKRPTVVRIGRLRIEQARLDFSDASRKEPFSTSVGPFAIDIQGFSTRHDQRSPYTFAGTTAAGEEFSWSGELGLDPLRSSGTLAFGNVAIARYDPYYADRVPVRIRDGRFSAHAAYELAWLPNEHTLKLHDGGAKIESLDVTRRGSDESLVRIPLFEVAGADIDVLAGNVRIGSVTTRGGTVLVRRDQEGKIDLMELAGPRAPSGAASPAPHFSCGPIAVAGYSIRLEDHTLPRPVELTLSDLALDVKGYDATPGTPVAFTASFVWSESGHVHLEGSTTSSFDRGEVAIAADELALRPLAPYIEPYADLYVTEGKLGAHGTLRFATVPGESPFAYRGSLRADGIASIDAAYREDLVRGASFNLAPIDFSSDPFVLKIGTIEATRPFLRWIIEADGSNNILKVMKTGQTPAGAAVQGAPPPPVAAPARIAIGKVRVREGRLDFTDRLIVPNVTLSIGGLDGTIAGLSSAEAARADLDLRGKVDGYAPFEVEGKINPLIEDQVTDLNIRSSGVELTTFGPYAARFVGYLIRKGKLDLDLHYNVVGRKLDARNLVTMEQFELGDKVESATAVKLPIKLAVALLRDRHGTIVLDVPVSGNLGDPDFHLGKVIWRVVLNTLGKIVTSPFTLLAKLFGGHEEQLSRFDFAPGETTLAVDAAKRLDPIVSALYERPGLSLEIAGTWDEGADTIALKQQRLERLLRDTKWRAVRDKDPSLTSPDAVTVSPDEYAAILKAAYDEKFPPPAAPPPPPPPKKGEAAPPPVPTPAPPSVEEMAQRLRDAIPVTPDDLRQLAIARAKVVEEAILATGKVEANRVFLTEGGKAAGAGEGPRVEFTLR
ncbi:MAG: DUF748 domain-containing protein [Thermoanaerobaculales bacterium]